MNLRSTFLAIAVFLVAGASLRADIFVYKGTLTRVDYEKRTKPFIRKCFVITDPVAKKFITIDYGTIEGQKTRQTNAYTGESFSLPRNDASVFDFYSSVSTTDMPPVLQITGYLRGLQKTVTFNQQNGTPLTTQRAKVLNGRAFYFGAGFGYAISEDTVAVTFDTNRTVDANVRDRTIEQYRAEVEALLQAQGFNP